MAGPESAPRSVESNDNNQAKPVEQKSAKPEDSKESKEREGLATNKDLLEVLPVLVQAIGRQWEYTTSGGNFLVILGFQDIKKQWKTMTKEQLNKEAQSLLSISKEQTETMINDNKRKNNGKFISPPRILLENKLIDYFGKFKDWGLSPEEALQFNRIVGSYQSEMTPSYEKELEDKLGTSNQKNTSKKKKQN